MTHQIIYVGDTFPSVELQVIDPDDGTTIDLTTDFVLSSAAFHCRFKNEGSDHLSRNMEQTDLGNGILTHKWQSDDFSSPSTKTGLLEMYAVLTDSGGDIITLTFPTWEVKKRV